MKVKEIGADDLRAYRKMHNLFIFTPTIYYYS